MKVVPVSKRQTLLVATALILISAVLVVSLSSVRLASAILLFIIALILLARAFLSLGERANAPGATEYDLKQSYSPSLFSVGQLFEATMGGMREGLLVVNKDMRVVA